MFFTVVNSAQVNEIIGYDPIKPLKIKNGSITGLYYYLVSFYRNQTLVKDWNFFCNQQHELALMTEHVPGYIETSIKYCDFDALVKYGRLFSAPFVSGTCWLIHTIEDCLVRRCPDGFIQTRLQSGRNHRTVTPESHYDFSKNGKRLIQKVSKYYVIDINHSGPVILENSQILSCAVGDLANYEWIDENRMLVTSNIRAGACKYVYDFANKSKTVLTTTQDHIQVIHGSKNLIVTAGYSATSLCDRVYKIMDMDNKSVLVEYVLSTLVAKGISFHVAKLGDVEMFVFICVKNKFIDILDLQTRQTLRIYEHDKDGTAEPYSIIRYNKLTSENVTVWKDLVNDLSTAPGELVTTSSERS